MADNKQKRKKERHKPLSAGSLGVMIAVTLAGILLPLAAGLKTDKEQLPAPEETPPAQTVETITTPTPTPWPEGSIHSNALFNAGAKAASSGGVTLLATGDNLCHTQLYEKAWQGSGYDFRPYYAGLKDFISSADIATINQETPMATSLSAPSGFPRFNTPSAMGDALIDAGFDVINLGNNHIYDQGSEGAMLTKSFFDAKDILSVGLYDDWNDVMDIRVVEKNGIRIAFVSFVEMTNHDPDGDKGDVVFLTDDNSLIQQLYQADQLSDIIVAHVHWGEENTRELTERQLTRSQWLIDHGVDIIIGNHPHVLQEMTFLTRASDGKKCPVAYSLGNFFSNQDHVDQLVSALWVLSIVKDPETGEVYPKEMGVLPIVTHYSDAERTDFGLYPLCLYSEEMAASHYCNARGETFSMDYIQEIFDQTIPSRYINQMTEIEKE